MIRGARPYRRLARPQQRGGALTVEFAIVANVLFILVIGSIVLSCSVFRMAEVGSLARMATRYMVVHGEYTEKLAAQYGMTKTAATQQEIIDQAIKPHVVLLNASKLTTKSITIKCTTPGGSEKSWNSSSKSRGDSVAVRIDYSWSPQEYFGVTTLSSASSMTMH